MEYRRLGRTNLRVSLLGLGSGGRSQLGQAHGVEQAGITAIVRRALDLGVNVVDTSPDYGNSEALLGNALADVSRDSYVMCTKFWPVRNDAVRSAAAFRESFEASLRRLQTDYVDVMYLHGVPPAWLERVLDELLEPLQQLQREGKVRFLGVTENFGSDHEHLMARTVLPRGIFDVAMIGYNVLSPVPATHVFPLAEAHDVGIVIMCAVRGRPAERPSASARWSASGRPTGCSRVTPSRTTSRSAGCSGRGPTRCRRRRTSSPPTTRPSARC